MRQMATCLFFLGLTMAGCGSRQDHSQGQAFYFYPRANVYFDIEQKEYYAFDSVASSWRRTATLDKELEQALGRRVLIDTPGVPVYRENARHRLIYSAALYGSPEELQRKFIEDSLKSVAPKPAPATAEPPPVKRKSGIRRFLDKIFGKKDKKRDEHPPTETREQSPAWPTGRDTDPVRRCGIPSCHSSLAATCFEAMYGTYKYERFISCLPGTA
ncbi:MAG: hypothetical protein JWP27_123, partial [Flaviaesturariibacter sp.]|nr:hypothetical protein [Flaviaesturariibacter sp.]